MKQAERFSRSIMRAAGFFLIFTMLFSSGALPAAGQSLVGTTSQPAPQIQQSPSDPPEPEAPVLIASQTAAAQPGISQKLSSGKENVTTSALTISLPASLLEASSQRIEAQATWAEFVHEDFEGAFPGAWTLLDHSNDGFEYLWGADNHLPYNGSMSGWPAKGGADGDDPDNYSYPDNLDSWMVYGPIDLSNASDAEVIFHYSNISDTTEPNPDTLRWCASADGTNFYGGSHSGDTEGWLEGNLDLTSVPTIGNLTGDSSVWIAFVFTSNASNDDYYEGPFLDDISIRAYVSTGINLTAATPSGWSNPVVPAAVTGTHATGALYALNNTYIDWAVTNEGEAITGTFQNCLYLDTTQLQCWDVNGLEANTYASVDDYLPALEILEGEHTLRLVIDRNNSVAEVNEFDNTWSSVFTWEINSLPNLYPTRFTGWTYPLIATNSSTITTVTPLDSISNSYLHWIIRNNGASISGQPFKIFFYIDEVKKEEWPFTGLTHASYLLKKGLVMSPRPTPGMHTLRLVIDPDNAIQEFNEDDNVYERIFTWAGNVCGETASALDMNSVSGQEKAVQLSSPRAPASPFDIQLKSGILTPQSEIAFKFPSTQAGVSRHILVQLDRMPDQHQMDTLAGQGVRLLDYIPDRAWIASVNESALPHLDQIAGVRWAGELAAQDKIAPGLQARLEQAGAENILVTLQTQRDTTPTMLYESLPAYSARVSSAAEWAQRFNLLMPANQVNNLLAEDFVQWVDFGPSPRQAFNDCIRYRTRVDDVQAAPYNLNGSGVNLGIWDSGYVKSHPDFASRLTVLDSGVSANDNHATHVAGTMAGDGSQSSPPGLANQWRGMAPGASLFSWDWNNAASELLVAIAAQDIDIANNSWGSEINQSTLDNCASYGDYSADAREYDLLVNGSGAASRPVMVVFASGDERDDGDCGMNSTTPYLNYGIIPPPGSAKNVLTVGATLSDNDGMTTFSSWGPVDDGRLKPELVAPGDESINEGGIRSTFPPETALYGVQEGTSMSAATISGISALVLQQYRATNASDPLPSTIKALLVQTAKDLDDATSYYNPGPDFASGYGRVNAKAAVDAVRDSKVREGEILNGEEDKYNFYVSSSSEPVKITLAWDDAAAAPNAVIALVNNLDLVLEDPTGTLHYPLVLNPLAPTADAIAGVDSINNVEQVLVSGDLPTGIWTVHVHGSSVLPAGQKYSLAGRNMEPETACYTITTTAIPEIGGGVQVSTPANCGPNGYTLGTQVTLTATAAESYAFGYWSGDAAGTTNPLTVAVNGNMSIIARFTRCYTLTTQVTPASRGEVSANPAPNCGSRYLSGTQVSLTATPDPGYGFVEWTSLSTNNPVTVNMTMDRSVTAVFALAPPAPGLSSPANNATVTVLNPQFSWSRPATNIISYELQIALEDTFDSPVILEPVLSTTSYVPEPLAGDQQYYWRVRATNETGVTGNWSSVRTFITPPNPPVLLLPADSSSPDTLRPVFDWHDADGADDYTIQLSTSESFSSAFLTRDVPNSSYTPTTDLGYRGADLYWRVRINYPFGASAWSDPWLFFNANPAGIPTLQKPTNGSLTVDDTPLLDWSDVNAPAMTALDGYQVQMSKSTTFDVLVLNETRAESNLQINASLEPNTRWYWRVRSENTEHQFSAWSSVYSFRTAILAPVQKTPLSGTTLLNNRPTIDWENVDGATSYTLQIVYAANPKSAYTTRTVSPSTYTFTSDLPASKALGWKVRANGPNGPGLWSPIWLFTTIVPVRAPVLVSPASGVLLRTLTPRLDWREVIVAGQIIQYQIEIATDSAFTQFVLRETTSAHEFTPPAGALQSNTRYYWHVKTVNEIEQYSNWTSTRYFRTVLAAPVLLSPTDMQTVPELKPVFNWEPVNGATSYTVQISLTERFTSILASSTMKLTTWTSTRTLKAGTLYYWRVRANGSNGPGDWSTWRVQIAP